MRISRFRLRAAALLLGLALVARPAPVMAQVIRPVTPDGPVFQAVPSLAQAIRPVPPLAAPSAADSVAPAAGAAHPESSAVSGSGKTYPPRYTARGFRIGAITGAAAGAAWFTFLGVLMSALDEGVDDDDEAGIIVALGLIGTAGGIVGGGALGAVIGGVNYKPGTEARQFPRGLPIGGFSVTMWRTAFSAGGSDAGEPAWDPGIYDPGFYLRRKDGLGIRASLMTQIRPWLAAGPEIGIQRSEPSSVRLAGAIRLEPTGMRAAVRPYLVGSLGGNFWEGSQSYLGADAGGGLYFRPGRADWGVELEGRYHWNVQNGAEPGDFDFATFGGGMRWIW